MENIYLVDWFDTSIEWKVFAQIDDAKKSFEWTYSKIGGVEFEEFLSSIIVKREGKPIARIMEMEVLNRADHF